MVFILSLRMIMHGAWYNVRTGIKYFCTKALMERTLTRAIEAANKAELTPSWAGTDSHHD